MIDAEIERFMHKYDYCDSLPLIGWAWEFGRRSDEYRDYWIAHQTILKNCRASHDYAPFMNYVAQNGPFGIHYLDSTDPSRRWNRAMEQAASFSAGLCPASPVSTFNMAYKNRNDEEQTEAFIIEDDHNENEDLIDSASKGDEDFSNEALLDPHGELKEADMILGDDHPLAVAMVHFRNPQVVMALFDISSPCSVDELILPVRKALVNWKRELQFRKRKAKTTKKEDELVGSQSVWKSYLIVYDLKEQHGYEFADIIKCLSKIHDSYSDLNTTRSRYKQAYLLVNGGYKNLIL
jgi:hypothetical protein